MSATKALLDDIAKLQAAQDAAALKAFEDHSDKQVRKAARKALHVLRSKGVAIPEQARAWAESNLQSLRQHAGPCGMLDMEVSPALTRITASLPNEEEGATLLIALLDPRDRLLDFVAYHQTDGQQARTAREWQRSAGGRAIPASWLQARIYWAREQTHRQAYPLPDAVDDQLFKLGEAPSERPELTWLDEALAEVELDAALDLDSILSKADVHDWPLLFDANQLLDRVMESTRDLDPDSEASEARTAQVLAASKGDEQLRAGLRGPLANALDDLAVTSWLEGSLAEARRLRQFTSELRSAAEPELVDGAARLVHMQTAAAALMSLREGGLMPEHDHDHDHHHDHDHDHG